MTDSPWHNHRVIMHLDMDAFFASVEQTIHPALRGKPVIVGGPAGSRGVVSTCSYEARNYGVHSAMPTRQAQKLCPQGIFLSTSGDKYSYMSVKVLDIMSKYSPNVEPVSIDEAFADLTGVHERYGGFENVARLIKRDIKAELGLTASIGIAPNRFVAKMGSSCNKPDGLVIVAPNEVRQFLWNRPVDHLWGVGPKSAEALRKNGIETIGDLARTPEARLKAMFGIMGPGLVRMANGDGEDEIRPSHLEPESKSMGHEHTFDRDTNDLQKVLGFLLYLSDKTSRRLRNYGYEGRTVTLKVRKSDFKLVTRAATLSVYIDTEKQIFSAARKLLLSNRFLDNPIRLIGVSMSHLRKRAGENFDDFLIDYDPLKKSRKLDRVLDSLRDKHGEDAIFFAATRGF